MHAANIRVVRSARTFIAAALVGTMLGPAAGQTAPQAPGTPAEAARAIAATIKATTRIPPGGPIALEAATSHDAVVEIRYRVSDAAAFVRFKGNVESTRRSLVSYYCGEDRRAVLEQGVVIHQVYALSSTGDQVEVTVDGASCDRLAKTPPADAKTLAALALAAAQAENAASHGGAGLAVRFGRATAHEGVVDLLFTVVDLTTAQQNLNRGVAALAGFYCTKYLEPISQGLTLHLILAATSGPPIFDVIIDRSKC